jgi:hypothetical protein
VSPAPTPKLKPEDRDTEMAALLKPPSTWAQLSKEQIDAAPGVMRDQTHRLGMVRKDGVGNCLGVANNVRLALIGKGVPADAVGVRVVEYDAGGGRKQQHALVDLQYLDARGRQQKMTLDPNSPWPLTPKEEAAAYRPVQADQNPYAALARGAT